MDPLDNLQQEGTLPVNLTDLDDLLDEAFSELDISSTHEQAKPSASVDYNDPAFWMKMSQKIQSTVNQNTSDIPEPLKFLQAAFESVKTTKGSKYEGHTTTHLPRAEDPEAEGSIHPLLGIPRYSSLPKLIEGKPPGFQEQMIPLLYALNHSTQIPIPSFLSYTPDSASGIKINNVPLIGELVSKYGYELAVGFGKLAMKNVFRAVPGVGIAITICETYIIYNRLVSSTMTAPVHIGPKDFNTPTTRDIEEEITLSSLSDEALVKKLIDLSDDVPTPILIGDFPSHIIGIYKDNFSMTPRVCMLSRAESAVTYDMCPPFKHYSNQQLAQKLVDIACGVEIHPAFVGRLPHIIGTYKHTHLKQVNEVYSVLCNDDRFEAEVHY